MNKMKVLGGIFIVAGTTIGAGMLALPVTTAFGGFFPALLLFFICWLLMLCSSFFFLDVNLAVRGEPNFISMAGRTLGTWGKGVSWVVYLLLLYSLTAAYITASTPLFVGAIHYISGITLPPFIAPFCLPVLFGFFVYLGTGGVDQINRLLMFGLIITFLVLVAMIPAHIKPSLLLHADIPAITLAIPVIFTSFGYHIVIPSLTTYFKHDAKHLRITIIAGSILPLVIYLLWQTFVLGVVPLSQLAMTWKEGALISELLARLLQTPWLGVVTRFFTFFAVITSFLGVALSLSDFLTDGFKLKKSWEGRLLAILLTFLPPLFFVLTYRRAFYLALDHAGALVAILLGILPAAMAWKLQKPKFYRTPLGRLLLSVVIILSFGAVIVDIVETNGMLDNFIDKYVMNHSR